MVKFFDAVRFKLGNVKNTKQVGWHVDFQSSGNIVTLTHESQFEKGTAAEVFMYRMGNQHVVLAGYRIESADLTVK